MEIPEEPPILKRQKAQIYYHYSERFAHMDTFINCFFNKKIQIFPNLYYFHHQNERDHLLKSRYWIKKFIIVCTKRKPLIHKQITLYLPEVLCDFILRFL